MSAPGTAEPIVGVGQPEPPSRKAGLARSGAASLGGQFLTIAVTTGATLVNARLLEPADFGLLAMVFALISFIGSFRDFGLPMAALQARSLEQLEASALFWTNLLVTSCVTLFMLLMAPLLAWFYSDQRLLLLTAVMSLGVLAPALANQHEALLTRQLRFGALVRYDIAFLLLGAVVGVGLAAGGAGYWALAAQFLVWQIGRAASVWAIARWLPAGFGAARAAFAEVRGLISIGSYLTGYRVVAHLSRDLDRVLIGFVAGAHSLGLYDAALRWARIPLQQLYTPLLGVAVAGLSHVRDDRAAYGNHARAMLTPVLAVSMPLLVYGVVAAEPLVLLLLGAKWAEAVPLFRALCIGAVALAATKSMKWFYVSTGRTQQQFRWGLISAPLFAGALATGALFGAHGVAVAYAVAQWGLLLPALVHCLRDAPLGLLDYLVILARPLLGSALAGVAAGAALTAFGGGNLAALLLTGSIFGLVYAASWLLPPGGRRQLREALRLVRLVRRGAAE